MNFAFSDEQEELRTSVRRFLAEKSPETEVRRLMETTEGYDPAVWSQMADQLGLQSLTIPEEFGGSGFTYVELIVVLEEMGAALLCAPFFSSVALAANALLTSGDDEAKKSYLPGIASGETIATLALTEDNGQVGLQRHRAARPSRRATAGRSNGHKMFVIDGHVANLIVVAARTAGGRLALRRRGRRRRADPHAAADHGPDPQAGPPRVLRDPGHADRRRRAAPRPGCPRRSTWPPWRWPPSRWAAPSACSTVSVEYAKTRIQFGRPIGSFQAIKHKCADMLLEVESAKSAAYYAGWAAAEDSDELPVVASLAKSYCSEAYFHAAAENIQIHGGIGFTWEHPAHLYFKRAKSSELLLGDPTYHRELLAQRIGI